MASRDDDAVSRIEGRRDGVTGVVVDSDCFFMAANVSALNALARIAQSQSHARPLKFQELSLRMMNLLRRIYL